MQYSKLIFALPVASAALIQREAEAEAAEVNYAYTTVVATVVETVVQTAGAAQPTTAAVDASSSVAAAAASYPASHGGGHASFHSSRPAQSTAAAPSSAAQPSSAAAPSSVAASSAAAPSASAPASGGSSGSGGCPADTSGQHTSPGINGAPAKSMIDSINYMRRLYNPNANCLTWSDSLASASQTCADAQSESHLRANSGIVSAPGYMQGQYYKGNLASSEFERSMIWMLCQSPNDSQLKGTCSGKTGEANCSSGACTGHHDLIVDTKNEYKFMGAAASSSTHWLSASFSSQQNAGSGY